jgi:UDP-glucose 6-dehydrogenase
MSQTIEASASATAHSSAHGHTRDPTGSLGAGAGRARTRVAVIHAGPLGLCSAVALARHHDVLLQDDRAVLVHMINNGHSPADDPAVQIALTENPYRLRATRDRRQAIEGAALVVVTTPTEFVRWNRSVDTSALTRTLLGCAAINPEATFVIESTVPVGYARSMAERLHRACLVSIPTLASAQRTLEERMNPLALIVGGAMAPGRHCASVLQHALASACTPLLMTGNAEAEAIHLLHQKRLIAGYAPKRAELERFATRHSLHLQPLIDGMSMLDTARPQPSQLHRHVAG